MIILTENELKVIEALRSGIDFEGLSESDEFCYLLQEICEANYRPRLELIKK